MKKLHFVSQNWCKENSSAACGLSTLWVISCLIRLRVIQNIYNVPVLIVAGLVVSATNCCVVDDIMFEYISMYMKKKQALH